ncbi:hypothetical protein BO70DRAFT_325827 [Aspergillus heteromorphus CBS 117.55]|uniref:Uncharacterized protein n=1 Tax=Aspergillus heteromorphus CBS 117.55 TaxID=1448321 RepID=A0A317UPB0_9EURO|nr:uncharacterized protein BO70DRAFT_325827 [Aspergillus heteromorphus CBS 117.55]PWY63551.1 hypothetical protein BO70DRAFT_325827 [Aspergillus heteromorphus CBS 117.55]
MHTHHKHRTLHGTQMSSRSVPRRPGIVPHHRLPFLAVPEAPTLVRREPLPSTESSASQSSSASEKPTSTLTTTTLPVVLGAVIPIVCAIAVLLYLHRRNVKKLRNEDANDKHKSLDFGLDLAPTGARPMQQAEKADRNAAHAKGVSLDIGPSPYLLPPGLQSSRESLHSLSRSIGDGDDDKYRHATSFLGDNASLRSHSRGVHDDALSFAGSSRPGGLGDEMNQGLLRNAQRMSRSSPPLYNRPGDQNMQSPTDSDPGRDTGLQLNLPRSPSPVFVPNVSIGGPNPITSDVERHRSELRGSPESMEIGAHKNRLSQLPLEQSQDSSLAHTSNSSPDGAVGSIAFPHPHHAKIPLHDLIPLPSDMVPMHSTPISTPRISLPLSDAASDYGDARKSTPEVPTVSVQNAVNDTGYEQRLENYTVPAILPEEPPRSQNAGLDTRRDTQRMTLGLRPLPPEDPSDNPEQRANRIRSFYKEYFDENRTGRETYYQDYGPEFYAEGGYVYDPMSEDNLDAVPAPFAEPVTRRAMTPPPRAPPRFQGAARHMATGSDGGFKDRFNAPGPRAFSSASGRLPGPQKPRKPAPPPSPLQILPTPHMLKDESIMSAIDYAPANHFKDQREGRPETPLGGLQPFSPAVPAHSPLVSAFDELSALPSAHALRKSGFYDNLDFALPPRFKNTDTGSDAGSIRSNRTGISTTHLHNIRTGAYRVSRLPPDTVGTKDDLITNLRPKWDMGQ